MKLGEGGEIKNFDSASDVTTDLSKITIIRATGSVNLCELLYAVPLCIFLQKYSNIRNLD